MLNCNCIVDGNAEQPKKMYILNDQIFDEEQYRNLIDTSDNDVGLQQGTQSTSIGLSNAKEDTTENGLVFDKLRISLKVSKVNEGISDVGSVNETDKEKNIEGNKDKMTTWNYNVRNMRPKKTYLLNEQIFDEEQFKKLVTILPASKNFPGKHRKLIGRSNIVDDTNEFQPHCVDKLHINFEVNKANIDNENH
ncbi:uncharacterized protein LOC116343311 [Contarinia nasturtii]|uniref:uncharacterized protein LOC116343311 n=1 Tax=Contarinia nasturtii TaxID=265458 RepID=UPI0012D42468|nr:uncharacterized protein LOC116343311 [Contarinia nasturtii]